MKMHQIVHLDFKGAPLKVPYLEKVLTLIKEWGATGILIEWEDTFPYSGELEDIGSQAELPLGDQDDGSTRKMRGSGGDGMYSMAEVKHILQFVKDLGIEAIQLIQTMGHMEYVLKHGTFKSLRETPRSPASLCPSRPDSQTLVRSMLTQALELQPEAKYLHIGADEVWHTATCDLCKGRASKSEYKAASLYLDHIRDVAVFLKQKRPDIKVLMWDDMLRSISLTTLKAYDLGELVEPVVWNYSPMESFRIDPALWDVYRQIFSHVWAGSAYKGANGSCQMLSPVSRYTSNHEAWRREIRTWQDQVTFRGTVLTGWSRFDHYATLCELMPVSLPSLASCLRVLTNDEDDQDNNVLEVLPSVQWPGEQLARLVHSYVILRERCLAYLHGDAVTTWLNPWQLKHNYTNPIQIEALAFTGRQLTAELTIVSNAIVLQLDAITGERSTKEWYMTFVTPIASRLTEVATEAVLRANKDASVHPTGC